MKLEKNSLGSDSDSSYSSKESSSSKAEAKPKKRRERAREEENMLDSLVSKTSSTSGLAGGTPGTVCGLQDEGTQEGLRAPGAAMYARKQRNSPPGPVFRHAGSNMSS